jgi:hypothetical protein
MRQARLSQIVARHRPNAEKRAILLDLRQLVAAARHDLARKYKAILNSENDG